MKFWVSFPIEARINFEVEADDEEDAKRKALSEYEANGAKFSEGIDAGERTGKPKVGPP